MSVGSSVVTSRAFAAIGGCSSGGTVLRLATSDAPADLATARVVVSLELRPSGASNTDGTERSPVDASEILAELLPSGAAPTVEEHHNRVGRGTL